ncbi:MAG: alpha/beta hydrolase [Candidatus Synoicihabitans palmerolidicus]|nr:alpha/beta hydrolase [Candidatus Synoicihabitans palmerolidicus]
MTQTELDAAYNQSVYAPNLEQVLARQAANNAIAREQLGDPRRYAYDDHPTEGLDLYPTAAPNAPIHLFIHGGTWRFGKAKNNACAAESFVHADAHFVVPDFSSVSEFDGDLMPLVDQLRRAVAWVHAHARESFGGDPDRIYLSGFSSGGHLAAALLTTDWSKTVNLPSALVVRPRIQSLRTHRNPRLPPRPHWPRRPLPNHSHPLSPHLNLLQFNN